MDNHGTRRPHGKSGKKATQRRAPAGLGFKATKSFLQNQETIASFIRELEEGTLDRARYSVGRVERAVGASHFSVMLIPSGYSVPAAGIAGYLKGGSPAAGTRIEPNTMVLVYDSREGPMNRGRTHTIIAVLGTYQTETILGLLGIKQAEEDDLFNRGAEEAASREEVAKMEAELAALRRSAMLSVTRKASSNNSQASATVSRKSSSSTNVNWNAIANTKKAATAAARKAKQTAKFKAKKAAKAAAKASAATGGVATWY